MGRKNIKKTLVFIDSSALVETIKGNFSGETLKEIIKLLNGNKLLLLIPEVTKTEIIEEANNLKDDLVKRVEGNLIINKILGIPEQQVQNETKKKKKEIRESNADLIDNLTKNNREVLIKNITDFYESISADLEKIFKHRNTEIIPLTDELIIAGMRRSLLKKAPYTGKDKSNESQHTKDTDCIAFESLTSFLKSLEIKKISHLAMCVRDKDYNSKDGKLHDDILVDISYLNPKYYEGLPQMINAEFKIKIGTEQLQKVTEGEEKLTLASESSGIDYSSSSSSSSQNLSSN